jgi:endonuclease/exonuclease/phosphatase family metal-dependent hydrolase
VLGRLVWLALLVCPLAQAGGQPLSVLSFNIWGGGLNQGESIAATVAAIRAADADLVGLQEVRAESDPCTGEHCPATGEAVSVALARELGYHHYEQRKANDALWANAILSRYPILGASEHDLGVQVEVAGRKGVTPDAARTLVRTNNTVIGAIALHRGDADALICGLEGRFHTRLRYLVKYT